ncbi:MAG: hypothetical protein PSV13_03070 [Lacunisphaera sp.]|nr:hypothetical protein [Lacunisphaera sp.]
MILKIQPIDAELCVDDCETVELCAPDPKIAITAVNYVDVTIYKLIDFEVVRRGHQRDVVRISFRGSRLWIRHQVKLITLYPSVNDRIFMLSLQAVAAPSEVQRLTGWR